MKLVGLLLAAGLSSRYRAICGRHKLLETLPHDDGRPLAVRAARALAGGVGQVLAIVRPEDEALAAWLGAEGCELLRYASPGLGASLAAGVRASVGADGWLVLPADLPFVQPATVAAVATALTTHACAAPVHAGQRGHPAGFTAGLRAQLAALSGDTGARDVLQTGNWLQIGVDDPGCVADIDVPADLDAVRNR